jgi:hypothetical protein
MGQDRDSARAKLPRAMGGDASRLGEDAAQWRIGEEPGRGGGHGLTDSGSQAVRQIVLGFAIGLGRAANDVWAISVKPILAAFLTIYSACYGSRAAGSL